MYMITISNILKFSSETYHIILNNIWFVDDLVKKIICADLCNKQIVIKIRNNISDFEFLCVAGSTSS